MASDAQKRASKKYDAANTVQFKMKLNKHTEKDIIERLEQAEKKAKYIKDLIRADIKKNPHA